MDLNVRRAVLVDTRMIFNLLKYAAGATRLLPVIGQRSHRHQRLTILYSRSLH